MKYTAFMAFTLATALTLTATVANATEIDGNVYGVNSQDNAVAVSEDIKFTDLNGYSWAEDAINTLASKGIVQGVGGNKYNPGDNVTLTEFVIMTVKAFGGDIEELAKYTGSLNDVVKLNGDYWGNEAITAARTFGLNEKFGASKDDWGQPATRGEMAYIVMTIAEQSGTEKFEIKDGIENNIGDYNIVSASGYTNEILKAYSNGILSGETNGNYSPMNPATRAQAAIITQHVIDPSTRAKVEVKAPEVVVPPVQEGENISQFGTVFPKEGDTINGKLVTRDSATGVLGLDVKGGIYLGINEVYKDGSKHPIKVGSTSSNSYDNMKVGDTYTERHGYIFWSTEWAKIDGAARMKLPNATSSMIGTKADIKGNIIKSGDTTTPAFWEVKQMADFVDWGSVK